MIIRPYTAADHSAVRQLARTAFTLTSFHTDPLISSDHAQQIIWQYWTRPVLKKKKPCIFLSFQDSELTGFLAYGSSRMYKEITGSFSASIILLAVSPRFRRQGTGTMLVEHSLNFFQKHNVENIQVGTDQDNLPARRIYEKLNFIPVLNWSTFRSGPSATFFPSEPLKGPPGRIFIRKYFSRPLPFLKGKHLTEENKKKIKDYFTGQIINKLEKNQLLYFGCQGKKDEAWILYEKDPVLSDILHYDFIRITDILCSSGDTETILKQFLSHLPEKSSRVECFLSSENPSRIRAAAASGMFKIHSAVSYEKKIFS